MKVKGRLTSVTKDLKDNNYHLVFSCYGFSSAELDALSDKELDIEFGVAKHRRSLNANALMWSLLGQLARIDHSTNWDKYLEMLKKYGTYTYICVKPQAVEGVKKQWRESEVIGEIDINGQKAVQMLCYYGSSTMTVEEFSRLLEGIIMECKVFGIATPDDLEFERIMDQYEKHLTEE